MPITIQEHPGNGSKITKILQRVEDELFRDFDVLIAGGSVRKAFYDLDLGKSDIDVFFKSMDEVNRASVMLMHLGCYTKKHPNCYGVNVTPDKFNLGSSRVVHIQLISKETYQAIPELLSNFDFTVCQFGYSKGKFITTPEATAHHQNNQLVWNHNASSQKPEINRFAKYLAMGYIPSSDLFERMFTRDREQVTLGSESLDEYGSLYGSF
jgi:hypothetical protein